MEKSIIFFDLDGTLTDSQEGITKSVDYALRSLGIITEDLSALTGYIGPPLMEGFQTIHGLSQEQARIATAKYRERYQTTGLYENKPYEGVLSMLDALKKAGKRSYIVTSKPLPFAEKIAGHFGITPYLEGICGATLDGKISDKKDVITSALARLNNPPRENVIMVGDRFYDIEGAKVHGLASAGVLYGFGSRAELEAAGADYIASDVRQLQQLLLSL